MRIAGDATVSVAESPAIERMFPPILAAAIERLLSQSEVIELMERTREITLRFTPSSQGPAWLLEARDGDRLLAFAATESEEENRVMSSRESSIVAGRLSVTVPPRDTRSNHSCARHNFRPTAGQTQRPLNARTHTVLLTMRRQVVIPSTRRGANARGWPK
jgi:hypothetical protein